MKIMPDKYTKEAGKILDFNKLRFNNKHHLGLGDIRITIGQQEEIEKVVADLLRQIDEFKAGSIEKVGVEDKRTLIKIRTSDNAHSFINWSYDWREIPKLCKKAKEELYNQLLILADKVKKEKKEKE